MRVKREYLVLALVLVGLALVPEHAFAGVAGGGGFPWDNIWQRLIAEITGPIAFGLAVFAMVSAGAALIMGRGEIGGFISSLLFIVLVAAVLINAVNLVQMIGGTGAVV